MFKIVAFKYSTT